MYQLPVLPISELKPYGPDAFYVHKAAGNVGEFYLMRRGRLYEGDLRRDFFARRMKEILVDIMLSNKTMFLRPFKSWKDYHALHLSNSLHTYLFKISGISYLNTPHNGLHEVKYKRVSVYSVIFAHRFLTP